MLVWVIKMLRNWQKRKQRSCVPGITFILINTFAKAYNPETAATDGGVAIIDKYDLEATPTKSTVAQVYDFIIKDIEEALPYLQEEPVNVYHPSKALDMRWLPVFICSIEIGKKRKKLPKNH